MKPSSIILILLVAASIVGTIILAVNYIHIKGVVKPLNVSVSYIEVDLGELQPLQSFDTGVLWYNSSIVTNVPCNVTVYLDASTVSQEEIEALGDPWIEVYLRRHDDMHFCGSGGCNLSAWAPPTNFTRIFPVDRGVYDVGVQVYGRTGIPQNETVVDFKLVVVLRTYEG